MSKILIVEDNEMNRDMLSRRLERKGYDVLIAVDGAQGVSKSVEEKPDLVLMDMSLPVMDGWTATKKLKTDPKTQEIPVIALTAHAMIGDREKALDAGCNEYDTKPIQFKRLLGKINDLLEKAKTSSPPVTVQAEKQEVKNSESMQSHEDLAVYKIAFDGAMKVFEISKKFPEHEKYSLTDRIRLSSRLVGVNLADAWIKRDDEATFLAKLKDSSAEAVRTKTWIQFAFKCNYLDVALARKLYGIYNRIIADLGDMINSSN